MTIRGMLSYLQACGFEASKKYISETSKYEFKIKKDGKTLVGEYEWIPTLTPVQGNVRAKKFLNTLMENFEANAKAEFTYDMIADYARERNCIVSVSTAYMEGTTVVVEGPNGRMVRNFPFMDMNHDAHFVKHMIDIVNNDVTEYIKNDINTTRRVADMFMSRVCKIENVIFNDPATIVIWMDGTKTVVKAENESFDPEKGLAMAIAKKALGNKGNYYETFKKWLPEKKPEVGISVKVSAKKMASGLSKATSDLKKLSKEIKKLTSK